MVQKEWRLLKLGSRSAPAPAHTWGRPARHVREVLPLRRSKLGLDCLNKKRGLTIQYGGMDNNFYFFSSPTFFLLLV